jgi:hypothetical protein
MPLQGFWNQHNREGGMSRHNYQVTLDEAGPGMVLSEDLLDTQGKTLLPAGTVLSEASIASLRRREVDTLSILGEEVSEIDDVAELERQRQRLSSLFRKHVEDDMATEILRQFIHHFRLGVQS